MTFFTYVTPFLGFFLLTKPWTCLRNDKVALSPLFPLHPGELGRCVDPEVCDAKWSSGEAVQLVHSAQQTRHSDMVAEQEVMYILREWGAGTTSTPPRCSPSCKAGWRSDRWRKERFASHRFVVNQQTDGKTKAIRCFRWWKVFVLLVEALLVRISQEPPVLPDFHQTLDSITHFQIFII